MKPDPTPIQAWLIVAGLAGEPLPQLFDGFCNRLVAAGVPLARGYVSTATLHPLLWATGIVWQQGRIIDSVDINYGFETRTAWLTSPFRHMLESQTWKLHRRLTGEEATGYRSKSLGHRKLRGVREPREVFTSASQP